MADYTTYLSDSSSCTVTQVFGGSHNGTDIQFYPIYWSNLYFPKSGTVSISQNGGSGDLWTYGEWYQVECDDGTSYRMAHLRNRAVSAGTSVQAGDYAGQQGNTGNTSGETGIHLHLEYFIGTNRVSPAPIMGFPDALGTYQIGFGGTNPPRPRETLTSNLKLWMYTNRRR